MSDNPAPPTPDYDDPNISALGFLYAVMRATSLSIAVRLDAATKLMRIQPDGPPEPAYTIRIAPNAELHAHAHAQALWDFFTPEMQKDLLLVKRCYEAGLESPDIADMEVRVVAERDGPWADQCQNTVISLCEIINPSPTRREAIPNFD